MARHFALIPAAGIGARMGAAQPKQYLSIHGRPMLWHAIRAFQRHPRVDGVAVVLSPDDALWDRDDWSAFGKLRVLRCGGESRAESVRNGLRTLEGQVDGQDWMLVHDAARPCLSQEMLDRLLTTVGDDPVGGILAMPVADTLKRQAEADAGERPVRIGATVSRAGLWGAQTPQMFRHELLLRAFEHAGMAVTDEASAVEALGLSPLLVESDLTNLKVTYPGDLAIAEWLLGRDN